MQPSQHEHQPSSLAAVLTAATSADDASRPVSLVLLLMVVVVVVVGRWNHPCEHLFGGRRNMQYSRGEARQRE